jgi:hypothetical protein
MLVKERYEPGCGTVHALGQMFIGMYTYTVARGGHKIHRQALPAEGRHITLSKVTCLVRFELTEMERDSWQQIKTSENARHVKENNLPKRGNMKFRKEDMKEAIK